MRALPLAPSLPLASLLLATAVLPAAPHAQPVEPAAEVEVIAGAADWAARLTVPVHLGERGPFRFLVDTGSQNTVISSTLAERLALVPGGEATVIGVAGSRRMPTVVLDEVALGRRSIFGLLAPVLDGRYIGADGIIGVDGLQGQRVLLDFRRNIMAIGDARDLGGNTGYDIIVTARRRSGQLIMTNAVIDWVKVDVVVDTGAESSIGNRALQRALARRTSSGQEQLTSVTGQKIIADIGLASRLELGAMTFSSVRIAYADSPAFAALGLESRPALLLGMTQLRLLRRVAIDFATRKVMFDGDFP